MNIVVVIEVGAWYSGKEELPEDVSSLDAGIAGHVPDSLLNVQAQPLLPSQAMQAMSFQLGKPLPTVACFRMPKQQASAVARYDIL